ncbi:MAG: ChaN family lipoprotein [Desulfatiglandales bacterium]
MKLFNLQASALLLLLSFILAGCAPSRAKGPPTAWIHGAEGRYGMGDIIDLHQAKHLDFQSLIEKVAPSDLVFVGEIHNNAEHHLIQVQILQALMECCGPVDVAMEFFRTPQQPVLDRFVAGEMTEREFLEKVGWDLNWGFPYHLYRPLITLARENGSRILAINVPLKLVQKVARVGLDGLTSEERERLPREIDLTVKAHREYVWNAYLMHSVEGIRNFQFFYEAQCVYEEVMAESLANYFEEAGRHHRKVVAFTGNGHLVYRFGVPRRVARRSPVASVTILPYALTEESSLPTEIADFLWLTSSRAIMPRHMPSGIRTGP